MSNCGSLLAFIHKTFNSFFVLYVVTTTELNEGTLRHETGVGVNGVRLSAFAPLLDDLPVAGGAAEDEAGLAVARHLAADEGDEADGAGEAGVGGVPVRPLQRHPLVLGVDQVAAGIALLQVGGEGCLQTYWIRGFLANIFR